MPKNERTESKRYFKDGLGGFVEVTVVSFNDRKPPLLILKRCWEGQPGQLIIKELEFVPEEYLPERHRAALVSKK